MPSGAKRAARGSDFPVNSSGLTAHTDLAVNSGVGREVDTGTSGGWTGSGGGCWPSVGAVVGGFTIGLIVTMLQAYLPPDLRAFRDAFAFAFVILVLLVRPSGLVPARSTIERV